MSGYSTIVMGIELEFSYQCQQAAITRFHSITGEPFQATTDEMRIVASLTKQGQVVPESGMILPPDSQSYYDVKDRVTIDSWRNRQFGSRITDWLISLGFKPEEDKGLAYFNPMPWDCRRYVLGVVMVRGSSTDHRRITQVKIEDIERKRLEIHQVLIDKLRHQFADAELAMMAKIPLNASVTDRPRPLEHYFLPELFLLTHAS